MRARWFWFCAAAAFAAPWLGRGVTAPEPKATPAWPATFEGRPLRALGLDAAERAFYQGPELDVERFTDGQRQILWRSIHQASRRVHSAAECYEGMGHRIEPLPLHKDASGVHWSRFRARKDGHSVVVREALFGTGQSWPDPSAWYWEALLGSSAGPWTMVSVAEAE